MVYQHRVSPLQRDRRPDGAALRNLRSRTAVASPKYAVFKSDSGFEDLDQARFSRQAGHDTRSSAFHALQTGMGNVTASLGSLHNLGREHLQRLDGCRREIAQGIED